MIRCRPYIALLLCAVISLSVLALPLSYLSFKFHQDYYAAVLCENPDKPITVCGGVCYLKKQLPPASDDTPATFVSKIDISVYFQARREWTAPVRMINVLPYAPHRVLAPSTYSSSLFHPPQG